MPQVLVEMIFSLHHVCPTISNTDNYKTTSLNNKSTLFGVF